MKKLFRAGTKLFFFIYIFFTAICGEYFLFAQESKVDLYPKKEIGKVDRKIFGNNLIAYDPSTYEDWAKDYRGYSDYGSGIWDPRSKQCVKQVVDLAKNIGVSVLRFPGGCGAHRYNWRDAVGEKRKHFLFGVDEFLKTCDEVGAEPVFTLSYFVGDEHDAAGLVKYLGSRVKYFEVGNEDWHGDHRKVSSVSPLNYAFKYLKYYAAIKAVDPKAEVGVILCEPLWDNIVMSIIKDKADFAVIHFYPGFEMNQKKIERMDPKEVFRKIINSLIPESENYLKKTQELLRQKAGRDIPIAITEFNAGLAQEKPLPYRHSLGTALVNAELLRIFMKPEHNILMANYWQFSNSYWGMVFSRENFMEQGSLDEATYIKRPNYYVFELYARYFGDTLIGFDAGPAFKDLSFNASKNQQTGKVYLAVVNKNMDEDVRCAVKLNDFTALGTLKARILNGAKVDALNEENPQNVRIREIESEFEGDSFIFVFPAHSLVFLEIQGKE